MSAHIQSETITVQAAILVKQLQCQMLIHFTKHAHTHQRLGDLNELKETKATKTNTLNISPV